MSMIRSVQAISAWIAVTALSVSACRSDLLRPEEGNNTSYPCGVWGVECKVEGTCCPWKHECGGHKGLFTTCPEGSCCYIGGDDWPGAGASVDGGPAIGLPHVSVVKAAPKTR